MSFYKTCETIKGLYYKHEQSYPNLHKDFNKTLATIERLSNKLDNYSREASSTPNHQLKIELGKLSFNYLNAVNSSTLFWVSKRVEFLHQVLDTIEKACILADDPYAESHKPRMVVGIENSVLHKETPCCNLFSFFCVSAEVTFCNEVLEAVERFNMALNFGGLGLGPKCC